MSVVRQNVIPLDSSILISLQLGEIKALEIQENIKGYDELFVTYSVAQISNDSIISVQHGSKMLGFVKQGKTLNLTNVAPLELTLKKGQTLGIQVSLWEMDDYTKTRKIVKTFNQVGGILQIPLTLLEWSSVSNPIGWFLWGTRLGGWGLDWLSNFDQNDLLGVSEIKWNWKDLPRRPTVRFRRGHWKGGKKRINDYHYEFSYQIKIKDISK